MRACGNWQAAQLQEGEEPLKVTILSQAPSPLAELLPKQKGFCTLAAGGGDNVGVVSCVDGDGRAAVNDDGSPAVEGRRLVVDMRKGFIKLDLKT